MREYLFCFLLFSRKQKQEKEISTMKDGEVVGLLESNNWRLP
jgi:hypothetical protein